LEFSASVGFTRKESVTMHGHMILKNLRYYFHFEHSLIKSNIQPLKLKWILHYISLPSGLIYLLF